MPKGSSNVAASVRQRLLNRTRERGEDFQLVLIRYAVERLLYRLSQSPYREQFVLKGAMLFSLWGKDPYRATRDLGLLGYGDNAVSTVEEIFKEICRMPVEKDGGDFLENSIKGEEIRDEQEYRGVRLTFSARLAGTRTLALTEEFYGDPVKQTQWKALIRRARLSLVETEFSVVVTMLREFLMPPTLTAAQGQEFNAKWPPGGPWSPIVA